MRLIIARHAETNKEAGLSRAPDDLSIDGHAQIDRLVENCRSEGVEAVFYSSQPRASATAVAISKALSVPMFRQAEIEERNFGDWDNWGWPQIATELSKLTNKERYTFVPPNGESWQQMEGRLRGALQEIATKQY